MSRCTTKDCENDILPRLWKLKNKVFGLGPICTIEKSFRSGQALSGFLLIRTPISSRSHRDNSERNSSYGDEEPFFLRLFRFLALPILPKREFDNR